MAVLPSGELLVTGDKHRIHVLDKQGNESRVIQVTGSAESQETTKGVAVDGLGRIIVTIGYQVFVLSPSGDVMLKFGDKGQGQQQLSSSLRVTVNSSNQIIVLDWDNHKLKIFDPAGRHLFTCGSRGPEAGQLHYPWSVITDSEDNIIVADSWNHRVSVFSRDGTFIRHVLTQEEHGLKFPMGLALTHDGHLVVSESAPHTFKLNYFHVKCQQDVPLPKIGVHGRWSNFLVGNSRDIPQQQPKGGTSEVPKDEVPCTVCEVGTSAQSYCVECSESLCHICYHIHRRFKATKRHKVVKIQDLQSGLGGTSLKHVRTVGGKRGSGDGQFNFPNSLAATAEGDIVVTDQANSRLQFLGKNGFFKRKVDLGLKPKCVEVLPSGELLVTGDEHRIHVLDKQLQGNESRVIQVTGAAETQETTKGVAVDGLGRIIVTIGYQIFVLGPSGDVMLKFGDKGQGQQQLSSFLRVTVNSSNQIIISDFDNHNLKIFDPAGRHLFTCGSRGPEAGQLHYPWSVITDSEDNIIVADYWNDRVSVFSRDGAFIRHVLTQEEHGLFSPTGLALTPDGHLIVSEFSFSTDHVKFFRVK
ncbi:uncharacterized protein [Branchiostoma lanceolatum]|uniref:uncharacterized protein n=1 Tax=Branchiostoma lanceolatum TaxID=7740 RepID=UPI00345414DC